MTDSGAERMPRAVEPAPRQLRSGPAPSGKAPAARGYPADGCSPDIGEVISAVNTLYSRLRRFDEWLRNQHQLSLTELHVLTSVSPEPPARQRVGRGSAAAILAKQVQLSPSGLTRLVDRLVERGLLARVCDTWDKRVTHLALTDAGLAMRDTILPAAAEQIRGTCRDHRILLERLTRITSPPDQRPRTRSSADPGHDPRLGLTLKETFVQP
jgi:DNA-binding MarR family transcriptional regulator